MTWNNDLSEMGHDATYVQVVITQCENGEEPSLRDLEGTFLVALVLPHFARIPPTSNLEILIMRWEQKILLLN